MLVLLAVLSMQSVAEACTAPSQVVVTPVAAGWIPADVADDGTMVGGNGVVTRVAPDGTSEVLSTDGYAYAISDNGRYVVGLERTASGERAVRWDAQGPDLLVPLLPGAAESFGADVNNDGVVVGDSYTSGSGFEKAFSWDGTQLIDLDAGIRQPHSFSLAWGINNDGLIVGVSWSAPPRLPTAMVWRRPQRAIPIPGPAISHAGSISDGPFALGSVGPAQTQVRWSVNGAVPVGTNATFSSVSNCGWVAGETGFRGEAVLWVDGVLIPLNDIAVGLPTGVRMRTVQNMSGQGRMAVWGDDGLPYLLTPVP